MQLLAVLLLPRMYRKMSSARNMLSRRTLSNGRACCVHSVSSSSSHISHTFSLESERHYCYALLSIHRKPRGHVSARAFECGLYGLYIVVVRVCVYVPEFFTFFHQYDVHIGPNHAPPAALSVPSVSTSGSFISGWEIKLC